jgi:hypothetical protein
MKPPAIFELVRRHEEWAGHSLNSCCKDEGIVLSMEKDR